MAACLAANAGGRPSAILVFSPDGGVGIPSTGFPNGPAFPFPQRTRALPMQELEFQLTGEFIELRKTRKIRAGQAVRVGNVRIDVSNGAPLK